ncbi:c-di-GMP-binding flagellar brake protein YcgR [Desulfobaculum xiamenense]|uniref:C-di-GMP-binding flagellar brake protein YcgR n=1 Tax=Desulfobaculum xiamenense TaxID=995050 RepID=A0A846QFU2_9BACT|nr:PilZ domain-containing protein [Desulfobaculum xiamenense]NJB67188.1 c-di-GMP-binding flagellar brake protein YcgR [Desulfobaculum xiamenense]
MIDDYSFSLGDEGNGGQRRAFRTKIPGLEVILKPTEKRFTVLDLSAMGLAFKDATKGFTEGEQLEFDLLLNKKLFLPELKARVMRVLDNGIIGLNFENNDHRKEARLDKLVLEVQKRMIALRKKASKQGT